MKSVIIKFIIVVSFLVINNFCEAQTKKLPDEAYYQLLIFKEQEFSYKNKQVVFPRERSSRCQSAISNKSFSCVGSKIISIDNTHHDNFEVSVVNESHRQVYQSTMKQGLLEAQSICFYDADFQPFNDFQYYRLKKFDCHFINKKLCDIIYNVYLKDDIDKDKTRLNNDLYQQFISILKSEDFAQNQKISASKAYTSAFNALNFKYGKNHSSSHNPPTKLDQLEYAISLPIRGTEYKTLLDIIENKNINNFKELEDFLDINYNEIGFFSRHYVTLCYGATKGNLFVE